MGGLTRLDRRLGAAVRAAAARTRWGPPAARALASAMSPAFRLVVAGMILRPASRQAGLRALAAGAGASLIARAARDRLGRPRPGRRADGGFPSRHAAAATAIALVACQADRRLGAALAAGAAAGLAARVAAAEHEPADIAAGVALGAASAACLERLARERLG